MYASDFDARWKTYFERLSPAIKERVAKKIKRILEGLPGRHLKHDADFFVEELGQYRICYSSDEKNKVRCFYFVGDHKQYEKWLGI